MIKSNSKLSMRSRVRRTTFVIEQVQVFDLASQIVYHIKIKLLGGVQPLPLLAGLLSQTLTGLSVMVQRSEHHLHRQSRERLPHNLSYRVGEVYQHRVQYPASPYLYLHGIGRTTPEIGKAQQSLDSVEGFLHAPPLG